MNRRTFCRTLATSAAMAASPLRAAPERPNIVYVLADDLGWGDLQCYNPLSAIHTPNANRLASEGMRFADMHSSSAVCTPSRYSILTGRYCWRSSLKKGVLNGDSPNLIEPGRLTVPALLQSAGYRTAGFGKWHLGLRNDPSTDFSQPLHPGPLDHGFDHYFGIPASLDMAPYLYIEDDHAVELPASSTPGSKDPRGVFWRAGACAPHFKHEEVLPAITGKAVEYIQQRARQAAQPFFLYLPFTGPHTPWLPLAKYRNQSKAGTYGDFVTEIDDMLGNVMRALDETGQAKNTLFLFASDNGADWKPEDQARYAHRANADWRGEKADIWEAGHRIPFLVRWPGRVRANTVSKELGSLTDLMATVAAVTGSALPANAAEDSFNLLPAFFEQNRKPIRDHIVMHSNGGMFSLRQGNWKLEEGLGSGGFSPPQTVEPAEGGPKGQLYDLQNDPGELHNLYQARPEVVDRLATLLERYRQQGHTRPM
ncbi:MAG: sulfatase-like hydrolase/transferase [Candidatus Sulfopaludibacter sp.]|nr:sulfatase-like hydrolase/transferase [Candidatus Sulfopaludibacter sp.]